MKRFSVILLSGVILLSPAVVLAQTASLEICNNGRFEIDVAVAARIQYIITGYRWESSGWHEVPARGCAVVYSEDYDEAGPITPQSGARIAYTLVNSDGVWGAYQSNVKNSGGWMPSGTGQICVKQGVAFSSTRPAGDPAANCDGITIPAADEFLPDHPGKYTLTMDWEGDQFFMPIAPGQQASVNTPAAEPPSVVRVPQRPRVAPIMIGKVDVSHLVGLQRGDTHEYISSILSASGSAGNVYSRGDGISIITNPTEASPLEEVKATGKKNGIVMSNKAMDAVTHSMANFHAETYAEFEAKSPAEQRRFIALLFRLA